MSFFQLDETHDPSCSSWVASSVGHDEFPVQNLPLGIFMPPGATDARGGIAIGDEILDLRETHFEGAAVAAAFAASGSSLNPFLELGPEARRVLRRAAFRLLTEPEFQASVSLYRAADCTMCLPATIGDYTDFYAGINHARKVGELFRPDEPLLPNYRHVPIGYHGRSSSVGVGEQVRRPHGQRLQAGSEAPFFGPTSQLDFELELGLWIGSGNALGEPIPITDAAHHIAGFCLLNDWSARDIQSWEYRPLGPFLGKNFATSVSPWIVTAEALAPYRIPQPERPQGDPLPLSYLLDPEDQRRGSFAIDFEVHLSSAAMRLAGHAPQLLCQCSASDLYWTAAQLIAHHTSGGCNLRVGDLFGTGTISGRDPGQRGSLLEITEGGRQSIELPGGERRTFLEDGDEVTLSGHAWAPGRPRIGFGRCIGRILASCGNLSGDRS